MNCEFLLASCKVILQDVNLFCELEKKGQVASCKFKEIILWIASCILWVENLKMLFYELPVALYELKVIMMMFTGCDVAFYKFNF